MIGRAVLFIFLAVIFAASSYYSVVYVDQQVSDKISQTAGIFAFALLLDIIAEKFLVRRVKEAKARFLMSKTAGYITYLVAAVIVLGIWIEQAQNLLFAMGVVGAGIAIALQRPVMNLVGFLTLLTKGIYDVGDRVEIDGEAGDVIDVELFYTKIMEIGKWTTYDQFTGRIKTVPNSYVLEKVVNNYSKDFGFIWEELMVPITYASDLKKARKIMLDAANRATKELRERSREQLKRMTYKYLFEPREVDPVVYVIPTDNWVELRLRFIVHAQHRRSYVNPIFEEILAGFSKEKGITISSKTSARVWDATRKKRGY